MSDFTEPMFWSDANAQKPGSIADIGYQRGDNPAAEHENYFRSVTYQCIKELQQYLFNKADKITFLEDENGNLYYLDSNGERLKGEQKINGIPYLFNNDGELQCRWQMVFGKRYYYEGDGGIRTGWYTSSNDEKYYITLMEGKLVNQYRTIDGKDWHFDNYGRASEVQS